MSGISRVIDAVARPLASTEGRKRALILLVAGPLALAFAVGAVLGAVSEAGSWSPLALAAAAALVAIGAGACGRVLLRTAQRIRGRQGTAWIPEKLRPLALDVSAAEPRRIDIVHPAIDLKHFFGGFIAVFNLALRLTERGHRVRLIATEASNLPTDWRQRISAYEGLGAGLDQIEVAFAEGREPVPINPADTLIATHWTVAHIAHAAAVELGQDRFVYLIQEYEPFIFPLGSAAALAAESYELPHRAIFSTALLRDYFAQRQVGVFAAGAAGERDSVVFDNAITAVGPVDAEDLRRQGRPRLLFYARPEEHAQRNLFELGTMALDRAVGEGTLQGWDLVGVGTVEPGSGPLVLPDSGARVEMVPRSAQADYADLLRSCDVGLALMYTPHPSLVPIEMAAAGMVTVTNTYENKDAAALASISSNLVAAKPTVAGIAAGLGAAVAVASDLGARAAGSNVAWPSNWDEALGDAVLSRLDGWIQRG
ncbi:MAG: hypothetical protein QOE56_2514 [Solirubrobacterales bacterium]|jgi:hypothetical protein|nr:hypothetical protein [Solirubrobacterales bacterium]